MAYFQTSYAKFIQPNEGYFSNKTNDIGGITYGGISYAFHPEWNGWQIVKDYIAKKGGLSKMKNNERIPEVDSMVTSFFENLWNKNNFALIKNQDVANIIFDWYVNSETNAIKGVQKIVKVSVDGVMGNNTITAINNQNPVTLNNAIKNARIDYYKNIVEKNPSQSEFLDGWLARINKFPTLTKVGGGLGLLLLLGLGVVLLVNKN